MKKDRTRQLLTIFSLFMLLVLPTAIVGYNNFSTLVNQAFAKPFQKEESTYIVQTESSANITKGSQFSLKVTAAAPKAVPLNHFAAFIEFDKTKVDVKTIQIQNTKLLKVMSYQNGFLVYPATMTAPENFASLQPSTCSADNTCNFALFSATSIVFTINGVLVSDLSEQQRPIKISMLGAAETKSLAIWNEKTLLPVLKLGEYVKNSAPEFTTEPAKYIHEGTDFTYQVGTKDTDKDPTTISLNCPESAFCERTQKAPEGLIIEDHTLTWNNPVYQLEPYEVTVYVNDGKSVSTQTFSLQVLQKDTSYFACTFTPAVSVKILDYRVETPLTIAAESSSDLTKATVTLTKDGTTEKTFIYTFSPASKQVILDQASNPSLSYKFNEGQYTGKAVFTSTSGTEFTCELTNPTISFQNILRETIARTVSSIIRTVQAQVGITVGTNNSPVFTSDPMVGSAEGGSSPSISFVYGNPYSFTLLAQDADGDPLQHTIVTKPSWASVAVASSNSPTGPSSYSLQFTGTPQVKNAGSNLFSVTVNDGYGHYITRTWVINIDYPNNDIPRVTIVEPIKSTTRFQGSGFLLKWEVEDRHQVVSFGVQYTKSLSASSKRYTYNNNISYNTRGITVNTASIPPGDYYFIVNATDGFSPPAIGSGYSSMVRILPPKPKPTPTPKPTAKPTVIPTVTPTVTTTVKPTAMPTPAEEIEPELDEILIQITSPKNQAQLAPQDFQSVVTLSSSKEGELSKDLLSIKLDGTNITEKFNFSVDKGKTITASYKPSVLLEPGIHELVVSAKDSKGKEKEAKISFTILENAEEASNSVNFLGFEIPKNLYTIFIAALILIVILVLMPLILYFAFRNSEKENGTTAARKPVLPLSPTSNPSLRTPNSSFANAPQAVGGNSTSVSTFQPVLLAKKEPVTIPNDIPTITPKEALDNFVAHSPMQDAKPTPSVVAPIQSPTQLHGPVFTDTIQKQPAPVIVAPPMQPQTAITKQVSPLQIPVQPIAKTIVQDEQRKPAPVLVQPPTPVIAATNPMQQQTPMMRMQPMPQQQKQESVVQPSSPYLPSIAAQKVATQPATIPGKQGAPTKVTVQTPISTEVKPQVPAQIIPTITASNPVTPLVKPVTIPVVDSKPTLPTQPQTSLPPESPPIPGI